MDRGHDRGPFNKPTTQLSPLAVCAQSQAQRRTAGRSTPRDKESFLATAGNCVRETTQSYPISVVLVGLQVALSFGRSAVARLKALPNDDDDELVYPRHRAIS